MASQLFYSTYGPTHNPTDLARYLSEQLTPAVLAEELAQEHSRFYLAEEHGKSGVRPVGYLQMRWGAAPESVPSRYPLEIVRLYVAAEYFGHGLGAALMARAVGEAGRLGCDTLWLIVWRDNHRAKAFYRKQGFRLVGTHRFRIGGTSYLDDVMARPTGEPA